MDLNTVEEVVRPWARADVPTGPGDAWLAGGSWLFSEPQPHLRRLFDLQAYGWTPLEADEDGLTVAATCTVAALERWSGALPEWHAATAIAPCCRSLVGSFKVWNVATVGGNICLALPAGPMTALMAALDGSCLIWRPDGSEWTVAALDIVMGERRTVLEHGDVLRSIRLPARTLMRKAAVRQISLSPLGRSGALLVGTRELAGGPVALTVTGSTIRPVRCAIEAPLGRDDLARRLDAVIPSSLWHDDVHGRPDWRRHVTTVLAGELLAELFGAAAA